MAVTSVWPIVNRLDHVLKYVQDKEKTTSYTVDMTRDFKINHQYISCINCPQDEPYMAMMKTKELFQDKGKRLAYHGYQSFKPGEGTPEQVHEIGVKMMKELFGSRHEVVITTHLDKEYLHNHFVINATSFIDGKKYCNTKADRRLMMTVSDRLCQEYGLSVIDNPSKDRQRNKNSHARRFIKEIKDDFDDIIKSSFITKNVYDSMRLEGYEFKTMNHVECICHPNFDKEIPISMLGEKYSREMINERVLANTAGYTTRQRYRGVEVYCKEHLFRLYKQHKLSGLQYIYVNWLVKLKIIPNNQLIHRPLSKETRQALRKLDFINQSTKMLCENNIITLDDLHHYQDTKEFKLNDLLNQRKDCYYKRSRSDNVVRIDELSNQITDYTTKIKEIRKELKCCKDIENRSLSLNKQINDLEQNQTKGKRER